MDKFQRNYKLEVEGGDDGRELHVFEYPLTLQFNISRAPLQSANVASLRLYNLNKDTRKAIYRDWFDNTLSAATNKFRHVRLLAGYGDNLTEILNGQIMQARSYREEGSTNFITEIDCQDWSWIMLNANSFFTLELPQSGLPISRNYVINKHLESLISASPPQATLGRGFVSNFDAFGTAPYNRAVVCSGNSWDYLRTETGDHCFIDNGVVHCLKDEDYFEGDLKVIDSSSGLLSTPKRARNTLNVDLLFEPMVQIGQVIELQSVSEPLYDGKYKIIGIQHSGIISGAVNGKCRTTLFLQTGNLAPSAVQSGISTPGAL